MALTAMEKRIARHILKYYSGDIPNIPEDDLKIQSFLSLDESGKRATIKTFLQNNILPLEQVNLVNLKNNVTATQTRIDEIQAYIAS